MLSPASNNKAFSANDSKKRIHQYNDLYIDGKKDNEDDKRGFTLYNLNELLGASILLPRERRYV
jgi:hypothetical protein